MWSYGCSDLSSSHPFSRERNRGSERGSDLPKPTHGWAKKLAWVLGPGLVHPGPFYSLAYVQSPSRLPTAPKGLEVFWLVGQQENWESERGMMGKQRAKWRRWPLQRAQRWECRAEFWSLEETCCSVSKSCPALCNSTDCSTPGNVGRDISIYSYNFIIYKAHSFALLIITLTTTVWR